MQGEPAERVVREAPTRLGGALACLRRRALGLARGSTGGLGTTGLGLALTLCHRPALGTPGEVEDPASTAPPTPASEAHASPRTTSDAPSTPIPLDVEQALPPPSRVVYFQYGVAFAAEHVLAPGPICDNVTIPCILGSGGGIVVRGGWRGSGHFYFGGAYELTKQDPNKLYRIALLQQARAEGRYYFGTARVTEPYLALGAGVAGYGNEWTIDTWGPSGSAGIGLEYQITRRTVVGLALSYRLLYFSRFTDTAGAPRSPGVAQLLGFDLVLEQRDAIVRSASRDRP